MVVLGFSKKTKTEETESVWRHEVIWLVDPKALCNMLWWTVVYNNLTNS